MRGEVSLGGEKGQSKKLIIEFRRSTMHAYQQLESNAAHFLKASLAEMITLQGHVCTMQSSL